MTATAHDRRRSKPSDPCCLASRSFSAPVSFPPSSCLLRVHRTGNLRHLYYSSTLSPLEQQQQRNTRPCVGSGTLISTQFTTNTTTQHQQQQGVVEPARRSPIQPLNHHTLTASTTEYRDPLRAAALCRHPGPRHSRSSYSPERLLCVWIDPNQLSRGRTFA